jgi:hypothetical protein
MWAPSLKLEDCGTNALGDILCDHRSIGGPTTSPTCDKLSPGLNEEPRHEDLLGMEVQLQAFLVSALLYLSRLFTPEKSPRCQFDRRLSGAQSLSGRCGEEKNFLSLPGIETHVLGHPARTDWFSPFLYIFSFPEKFRIRRGQKPRSIKREFKSRVMDWQDMQQAIMRALRLQCVLFTEFIWLRILFLWTQYYTCGFHKMRGKLLIKWVTVNRSMK